MAFSANILEDMIRGSLLKVFLIFINLSFNLMFQCGFYKVFEKYKNVSIDVSLAAANLK